jgi:hypothetical protein
VISFGLLNFRPKKIALLPLTGESMSIIRVIVNEVTPPVAKRFARILWNQLRLGPNPRRRDQPVRQPIVAPLGSPKYLMYVAGNPVIAVPVERLRYCDGRGYNHEEHHFLQYYNGGIDTLRDYYKRHQPTSFVEHLGLDFAETDLGYEGGLFDLPWFDEEGVHSPGDEKGLGPEHGNQAFGPISEKKLRLEAARLDRVLESIQDKGFRPEIGGYIRGYFMLRPNGQWVFTIREGFHRAAAPSVKVVGT